jgi:tetratricopeptide (TPR) repeat protein
MNRHPAIDSRKAPLARLAEWRGTERYRVRRCIGTGAVGAVYEAFDAEREAVVALKKLRHFSPATLYLFKQEFRTLADVHHPNLVRLYELFATEDRDVFFTMELVHGVDLVAYVRPEGVLDVDRLRPAMRQLVEGVEAIHAAGKLHRDIKPSNVMMTPEGRAVLLDFGVAIELARAGDDDLEAEQPIVGTASYMAPEQASGAPLSPASDWYGVGAVLFEALVGSPPFLGSVADVLKMKRQVAASLPSACAEGLPPDLDALCGALMNRAADERPTGPEILRRLGVSRHAGGALPPTAAVEPSSTVKLVGRRQPLGKLREAFEAVRAGNSVTVRVHGPSGMGKSALVQEFLDGLVAGGDALILRGRAYERESVPYKAIDGWVDALSRHLLRLSDRGDLFRLPGDTWALARIFPVLRRAPEIGEMHAPLADDPHRMRRRAFAALRELLASLAERQPVVVFVDDVHWGDADSAALLLDLVRPPNAPPVLFVLTHRDEQEEGSPLLAATQAHWPPGAEVRTLTVGPLDEDDAGRLALALLGAGDDAARAAAAAIARESHGSPFLVEELVRAQQARRSQGPTPAIFTLDESVAERVALLPDDARLLLEVVAVSGLPLPVNTVSAAAGELPRADEAFALLRAHRFVRFGLRAGREIVETTHDRIREAIVSRLPPGRTRLHHGRLARVLEANKDADPQAVAIQLLGAGEYDRVGAYAERAAEQAIAKVAFDRAVQLFRLALDHTDASSRDAVRLRLRLAGALAWAGRGAQAAQVFLEAAERETGAPRIELERAAAEQLLSSGRIDEGARVLHGVLAAIGMRAPRSTLSAVFWLVVYRAHLAVVGIRFRTRGADDVRAEDRMRIDAMYAVAMGFAIVDVVLAACMQARVLIHSLRGGDRHQILRAAALEATQLAATGGRPSRRERQLIDVAEAIREQVGDDAEAGSVLEGAKGVAAFLRGQWRESRVILEAAHRKLPDARSPWFSNANLFAVRCLYFSGEIKELVRRQASVFADAQDRGDLYTLVNYATTTMMTTHLAADDPESARRCARENMARWSQTRFLVQHWQAMAYEPDVDLYLGNGGAAYDRLLRDLPALRRSLLLNVQFVRGMTCYARGRCAVASIGSVPKLRRARIAEARRMARRLARERMPWTSVLAAMVSAAAENADGRRDEAIASLRRAVTAAESTGMAMHAAVSNHRLGEAIGGSEGAALTTAARAQIDGEGIRNAARWLAIYLPGTWEADEPRAKRRR